MDELIGRLASRAGIDSAVAEKPTASVVVASFSVFSATGDTRTKVQGLIDQIAGVEAAIAASGSNGGVSRLMDKGLMAIGTRLMAPGTGMQEIQHMARELLEFGRDKIGADQMGEIISGTSGLSQLA